MAQSDDLTRLATRAKEAQTRVSEVREGARAYPSKTSPQRANRLRSKATSCVTRPRKARPGSRAG